MKRIRSIELPGDKGSMGIIIAEGRKLVECAIPQSRIGNGASYAKKGKQSQSSLRLEASTRDLLQDGQPSCGRIVSSGQVIEVDA